MTALTFRRSATPFALALLLALLAALTGCGGSESASDVVARAFGKGESIKSATVDVKLDVTGAAAGDSGPLKIGLKGPYASDGKSTKFDFAVDLGGAAGGSSDAQIGLLSAGGATYVKLGGQPFLVGNDVVDGLKDDQQKGKGSGLSFKSLGIDPRSWLKDPKTVGDEQLAGEDVTHVKAGVDQQRLGDDLVKLLSRAGQATGASQAKEVTATVKRLQGDIRSAAIDIWAADGSGKLRRMKLDLKLKTGAVVLDFGLSRINEPVTVTQPKNAPKLQDALAALQQGQGGSASGTGSSSSSGGSSSSSGSSSSDGGSASGSSSGGTAYDQCVADAGSDVTKLQRCAKLQ
ncbi:hypothetical protein PAI11_20010 [Patulibacter medicamentivorans]|jgi:hypothetical protein|uniref:Lipoprotein n=1 Tax=Patulibacter medicamentivorans TaxID=1097667 RepID=H0E5B1_9ACTN|nr:hypothetical protein [Patulibacter medicamentivorans]EHN11135.1 hypothetical protein PAI11_20010 [Patulibacter medicamentivorans]